MRVLTIMHALSPLQQWLTRHAWVQRKSLAAAASLNVQGMQASCTCQEQPLLPHTGYLQSGRAPLLLTGLLARKHALEPLRDGALLACSWRIALARACTRIKHPH